MRKLVSHGIIVWKLHFVIFNQWVFNSLEKHSCSIFVFVRFPFSWDRPFNNQPVVTGEGGGGEPGISYGSRYEKLGIFRTSEHFWRGPHFHPTIFHGNGEHHREWAFSCFPPNKDQSTAGGQWNTTIHPIYPNIDMLRLLRNILNSYNHLTVTK